MFREVPINVLMLPALAALIIGLIFWGTRPVKKIQHDSPAETGIFRFRRPKWTRKRRSQEDAA